MAAAPFACMPGVDASVAGNGKSPSPLAFSFSAILSALSFAIDLTEAAVPGHALRTCIIGMRLGQAAGVRGNEVSALYQALLLKDIGCSSNAARMCEIVGGDDRTFKTAARLQDWTRPWAPTIDILKLLWSVVLPSASTLQRLGRIGRIAMTQHHNNQQMIAVRCERGADIARKLGLSPETAAAIHALDEHWDGSGYPNRLRGQEIPLLARILAVAQHLDVFASERNPKIAMKILRDRSGRWFDPALVDIAFDLEANGLLWQRALPADGSDSARQLVLNLEPDHAEGVGSDEIDRICEAFAAVVDAKSPFTYRHSVGVAEVATSMAGALLLTPERLQLVRRAALLHDLGKLAVPNTILDKAGDLSSDEWAVVVQHPRLTREILTRIEPFAELAQIAGAHHEKLDGTGYPDRLTAKDLSLEARIIAVADIYQALTERRSYRQGMSHSEAMKILYSMAGAKLDSQCVSALSVVRDPWTVWIPTLQPPTASSSRRGNNSDRPFADGHLWQA